jgi:hypothetical protein
MSRLRARLTRLARRIPDPPPELDDAAYAAAVQELVAEGVITQDGDGSWVPTAGGGILRGALLIALRVAADAGEPLERPALDDDEEDDE